MSTGIWIAIEDYDALLASPQDEVLIVILRVIAVLADEAIGCLVQASDIVDSPRRP